MPPPRSLIPSFSGPPDVAPATRPSTSIVEEGEPMVQGGGMVAVVAPDGVAGVAPRHRLPALLAQGYRLEGQGAYGERRAEQLYGDDPLRAGAEGLARGLTFGASDVVLGAIGGQEGVRERKERNTAAALAGEAASFLAPAGAGAAIGRLGGKAAAAAGGTGVRALAARGAAEGALLGAQGTVSDVALSDDPMSAEAIAGNLAQHVLLGGGAGAAGGALGELVARGAGKARQALTRIGDDLAARAAQPGEKVALEAMRTAELERLAAKAVPERASLVEDLGALRADQKPFREALKPRLASASAEVRSDLVKAERSLAGLLGNPRRFAGQPEAALEAVANYETLLRTALGAEPPQLGARMLDRVGKLRERLEVLAAGPSSPKLAQLDTRLAELAKAPAPKEGFVSGLAKDAAGAAVFAGASSAADALNLPGAGMVAFLLAGKLGGRLGNTIGNAVKTRATEVGARIARVAAAVAGKAEKAAGPAIARAAALSPESFEDLRDTALEAAADPAAAKARINSILDGVRLHDPILADQIAEVQLRGMLHLAEVAPKAPGGPTLVDQRGQVSRMERDKFLRRAEVVLDPMALLDALEDGTLTPSMVVTADAVHRETMANLRGRLLEQLQSGEISPRRQLALSILLGAPATPSLRPENIAAAQARINQDVQAAARRPQPSSAPRPEEQTAVQRRAGR